MALDGIVMHSLCSELNNILADGKIDKIMQPEKDEIIIYFRTFSKTKFINVNYKLLISANPSQPRVNITFSNRENPIVAPNFCMLLRKHLNGAKLIKVSQPGMERVLIFHFESKTEMFEITEKNLIVEIMGGSSNIIFTSSDGRIYDAIRQINLTLNEKRSILPGLEYQLPPAQDKYELSDISEDLIVNCNREIKLNKFLCETIRGFSPLISREIAYSICGDTDILCSQLSQNQRISVYNTLLQISKNIYDCNYSPVVIFYDKPKEFYCFDINQYNGLCQKKKFKSISEAIDEFYAEKSVFEHIKRLSSDINKLIQNNISRLSRKIEIQNNEIEECKKNLIYKKYGDIITANMSFIKRGETTAYLTDYSLDIPEKCKIELDSRLTPAQNAQRYYKKYKKARTAISILFLQIPEAEKELEYLKTVKESVQRCVSSADLNEIRSELLSQGYIHKSNGTKKKNIKSVNSLKPLEFVSDDGYTIYVGKNNLQNDMLTLRMADKHDWWLHVKNAPGSHVIITCKETKPSDIALTQAAILAATYSSMRDGIKVEVDYTQVKNVKKPSGARPGMVIYSIFNTAVVDPSAKLAEKLKKIKN